MPQTSVATVFSNPAYVLVGDPTTLLGADMVDLGLVPSVEVQLQFSRQLARNELNQIMKDGVSGAIIGATITLSMQGSSAAILAALIHEITDATTSVAASTDYEAITPQTLAIVPLQAKDGAGASANLRTQWVPAAVQIDVGAFMHQLLAGGGDDANPFSVTFEATLATADQDSVAITEGYRIWFMGDPADGGSLIWSLPAGYDS